MAAVDKIYGTKKEYDEFHLWCSKHNPKLIYSFYDWDYLDDGKNHAMTNFSEEDDKWLLKNCPLTFITDRIKEQYNL
jgi:hypothetical protein